MITNQAQKKVVLITGGSGLLGQYISQYCNELDYEVRILSRSPRLSNDKISYFRWSVEEDYIDPKALVGVHAVIHLAGATIAKKWTKSYKQKIIDSRVQSAQLIFNHLQKSNTRIAQLISASASGYYIKNQDRLHTENDANGHDFLAEVCKRWENAAIQFQSVAETVTIHRIGLVLAAEGGALPAMVSPIKMNISPRLGHGHQLYPWIHIKDVARRFVFSLQKRCSGVFNANTNNCTQRALNHTIAQVLNKRTIPVPTSKFILQLSLGAMSQLLTDSIAMDMTKLERLGFQSQFSQLDNALDDLLKSNR